MQVGEVEAPPTPEDPGEGTREPVRGEAFWRYVQEIRRRYGSDVGLPFQRLGDRVRRWFGVPFFSTRATLIGAFVGVASRLALALAATGLAGDWALVPWARWAVVLAFYGLFDGVVRVFSTPLDEVPLTYVRRRLDHALALLPTIAREGDVADLAAFARRWIRLPIACAVGVAVAAATLGVARLTAASAFGALDAGTLVLLAIVLFDFGSVMVSPTDWLLMKRESRYDHELFWASPADAPEVRNAMVELTGFGFATGGWITVYLVLAVVLVSWGSPLVLPVAGGFVAFGYVTTFANTLGARAGIQRIVQRAREARLASLRRQIAAFGPRIGDLSPNEAGRLRDLMDLHDRVRDAPTTPTASRTLLHTAAGLIVPSILFLISVSGEVYAERVLDAILP